MDESLQHLLDDMLQAAREAVSFVEGSSAEEFHRNIMAQRAVTMCIHTIGECAARLAEQHSYFVAKHPRLPLDEMRGMRNRIAHGYSQINFHTVWRTATEDLPALIAMLEGISARHEGGD
jgi:uncharacterized protein with HEPN domain